MVSRLIVNEVALKWLHHTTGQWTIKATPQVVHEIERMLISVGKSMTCYLLAVIQESFALKHLTVAIDLT